MYVYNPVTRDARVVREASTLAAAGHEVTVVGRLEDTTDTPAQERSGGFVIRRVRAPVHRYQEWAVVRHAPWRRLARAARDVKRAAGASPPDVDLPASAVAAGLLPWMAVRGVWRLVRGRAKRSSDGLDWLMRWRLLYRGWAARAAREVPDADVHHGHDLQGVLAARLSAGAHSRVVYDSHELFLEAFGTSSQPRWAKRILAIVERNAFREAMAVITVNPQIAKELRIRYGERPKLTVLYNAAPLERPAGRVPDRLRTAAGIADGVPVVISHGALSPDRGLEQLVTAMADPHLAGVHLVLLGDGVLGEPLADLARELGLTKQIHFLPAVPPQELLDWIAPADVAAMPILPTSLNNRLSTPNKLFESLAAGVPVVTPDLPARRPIVMGDPAGPLGELCDSTDPASIAGAIRAILERSPGEREALRERCREAARERWNWEIEGAKLVRLYAELEAEIARGA